MIRALVASDTDPPPFSTLLVVWKLTPERAATSLTETCLVGLRTLTLRVLCAGSERSPNRRFGGGEAWDPGPSTPGPASGERPGRASTASGNSARASGRSSTGG